MGEKDRHGQEERGFCDLAVGQKGHEDREKRVMYAEWKLTSI